MACNMGDLDAIGALYEKIGETWGRLDILVNNAATNPFFGELAAIDEEHLAKDGRCEPQRPFFS